MERGRWIRATEASPGHPHASFLAISAAERVVPATCSYSRTRGVVPTLGIPAHQSPDVAQRQDVEDPYFRGLLGPAREKDGLHNAPRARAWRESERCTVRR